MPKVIFSAFQPKTQMWVGFAGAACFLVGAIMSLLQTPITMGDVFSVLNFLFGAAFLSYVGYSGYRRQHGAAVENPVNMDPRSRQKIDLVMIALANGVAVSSQPGTAHGRGAPTAAAIAVSIAGMLTGSSSVML